MEYLILKWIHILSAILLFGTGLGSAFYKFFSDRSGDRSAIAVTNRLVVRADWIFTTPAVIIQPVTGVLMLALLNQSLTSTWVLLSIGLYLFAGLCWLPVVVIQIQMRNSSDKAQRKDMTLPDGYSRQVRLWTWLGIPAFSAMIAVTALMVFKLV